MVLDFCSQVVDGVTPTTRQATKDGNFDILNFLWFAGSGGLFWNEARNHNLLASSFIYGSGP